MDWKKSPFQELPSQRPHLCSHGRGTAVCVAKVPWAAGQGGPCGEVGGIKEH